MMIDGLQSIIRDRLKSEGLLQKNWAAFVLGACAGKGFLDEALSNSKSTDGPKNKVTDNILSGAYLTSLTVEGFRGIGPKQTLTVSPGPGLTIVVGRNGSGKSSFAEALEVALTGDSKRW